MYKFQLILIVYVHCICITSGKNDSKCCAQLSNVHYDCVSALNFFYPQKDAAKVTVSISETSIIKLECEKTMTMDDSEAIPLINVSTVRSCLDDNALAPYEMFVCKNCAIPPNGFADIIRKFNVTKPIKSVLLDECAPSDRRFRGEHFNGFGGINVLEVKSAETVMLSLSSFENLTDLTELRVNLPNFRYMNGILLRNQRKLEKFSLIETPVNFNREIFYHLSSIKELHIEKSVQPNTLGYNAFKHLHNVKKLTMVRNGLTSLPDGLLLFDDTEAVTNLTIIEPELVKSESTHLILGLRHLTSFTFSSTSVETINFLETNQAYDMTDIDLSDNKLTSLPRFIFLHSRKLRTINLANNRLTAINPQLLLTLDSIRLLNLSHNSLTTFPRFDYYKKGFEVLDLSNNQIGQVSALDLNSVPSTTYLSNNRITTIDFTDIHRTIQSIYTKRHATLHLDGNPINCDDSLLEFVEFMENPDEMFKVDAVGVKCSTPFDLAGQSLSQIGFNSLMHRWSYFDWEYCSVGCDCNFRLVGRVFVMNCTRDGLRQLQRFPNIGLLRYRGIELNFANQNVTEFPNLNQVPGDLNVIAVNASNNNISHFSRELFSDSWEWLDLSKNQLASLDKGLINSWNANGKLKKLSLGGNPWKCVSDTLLMRSFINSNIAKAADYRAVTCANKAEQQRHSNSVNGLIGGVFIFLIAFCLCILTIFFISYYC